MRNQKKDEMEMAARRRSMLEEGFRLFAEKGIETVSMQDVAKACNVGIATLYRYYSSKLALVLDIGTSKWKEYASYTSDYRKQRNADQMTAAEEFELYLDFFFDLYLRHRDLLCFNQSLNNFVRNEKATPEQLEPYIGTIREIRKYFCIMYEKGARDGTIRTEQPAEKVFSATCHIMLAVVVRYAQGLLFSAENEQQLMDECALLKKMILKEYVI